MNLKHRIQKLEKQTKAETITLVFTDGDTWEIPKKRLRTVWQDVAHIHENELYQDMKAKFDAGHPDTTGLIHLMVAYDQNELKGVWDDELPEPG